MRECKEVKVKDLLIPEDKMEEPLVSEITGKMYFAPEFHLDFVAEEYIEAEHGASTVLVVINHEGELWGFEDWVNSEGERGINVDYKDTLEATVTLQPVKAITVTKYVTEDDENF
jgi:hypothetical protein